MGVLSPRLVMVVTITKYPVCSREKDGMGAGWYRVVNGSEVHGLGIRETFQPV